MKFLSTVLINSPTRLQADEHQREFEGMFVEFRFIFLRVVGVQVWGEKMEGGQCYQTYVRNLKKYFRKYILFIVPSL